jgi:hypothetical protein
MRIAIHHADHMRHQKKWAGAARLPYCASVLEDDIELGYLAVNRKLGLLSQVAIPDSTMVSRMIPDALDGPKPRDEQFRVT